MNSLIKGLSKIFESSQYSDFTVTCKGNEWNVHRAIVCSQSTFFAAACDGNFKEAKEMKISLEDDHPPSVNRMLSYLYTRDYDDEDEALEPPVKRISHAAWQPNEPQDDVSSETTDDTAQEISTNGSMQDDRNNADGNSQRVRNNTYVIIIADKYNLTELEKYATSRLGYVLKNSWYPCDLACMTREIYQQPLSPRSARDLIIKRCTLESAVLSQDDSWVDLIRENSDIAVDLFREFAKDEHYRHL